MICKFIKSDGKKCRARALKSEDYCFAHSKEKEIVKKRHAARVKGGANSKRIYKNIDEAPIDSIDGAVKMLSSTIKEVKSGELPVNRANSVGYLLNILIKSLEIRDIEQRLVEIEDQVVNVRWMTKEEGLKTC